MSAIVFSILKSQPHKINKNVSFKTSSAPTGCGHNVALSVIEVHVLVCNAAAHLAGVVRITGKILETDIPLLHTQHQRAALPPSSAGKELLSAKIHALSVYRYTC